MLRKQAERRHLIVQRDLNVRRAAMTDGDGSDLRQR